MRLKRIVGTTTPGRQLACAIMHVAGISPPVHAVELLTLHPLGLVLAGQQCVPASRRTGSSPAVAHNALAEFSLIYNAQAIAGEAVPSACAATRV